MSKNKNKKFGQTDDLADIRRLIGEDLTADDSQPSIDDILHEFNDDTLTNLDFSELNIENDVLFSSFTEPGKNSGFSFGELAQGEFIPAAGEKEPEYTEPEYTDPEEYIETEYTEPEYIEPEYIEPEYAQVEYAEIDSAEPEYAGTDYSAPAPADDTARIKAEKEAELIRRREELKRANEQSMALADEIASSVDAAMDDKRGSAGERTAKLPSQTTRAPAPNAAVPAPSADEMNQNGGSDTASLPEPSDEPKTDRRISTDLRAFRGLYPDEAAVKAKRAVGYYSWCSAAVMVLAVLSWYITSAPTYKMWLPKFLTYAERPYITLLFLTFIQSGAMFISRSFIADGIRSLIKFDFKAETLLTLSCILTLFYTLSIIFFPAWSGYLPCVPCALFGLFAGLFARRQRYKSVRGCCRAASRTEGNYTTVKGMRDTAGTVKTVYKTEPSRLKSEFMDSILEEDEGEQLMRFFAPIAIIATFLFALITSVGTGRGSYFLWHWSTLLSITAPAGIILSQVIPFAAVSNKLSRIGVSLMGRRGIDDIAGAQSAILTETDIFPAKMVTVNGVKVFNNFTQEKVNLCTLAVLKASGSNLFNCVASGLPGRPVNLPPVEGFEFYETGGVGAYVNGEKVLVGTANFILRMAIRVPEGINLKNCILVAINMQFAGVFSIKYDIQPSVRRSLAYMVKHKLTPVAAVRDFNMTPQLITNRFKINEEDFDYPELEQRIAYSAISGSEMDDSCAVCAVNNLHSFSEAVASGKRVKSAIRMNMLFGYLAPCLGVPLMFYLLFMKAYTVVTPANIFYYLLLFFIPTAISAFGANRR